MKTYRITITEDIEVDDDITEADVYRALNGENRDRWLAEFSTSREDYVDDTSYDLS